MTHEFGLLLQGDFGLICSSTNTPTLPFASLQPMRHEHWRTNSQCITSCPGSLHDCPGGTMVRPWYHHFRCRKNTQLSPSYRPSPTFPTARTLLTCVPSMHLAYLAAHWRLVQYPLHRFMFILPLIQGYVGSPWFIYASEPNRWFSMYVGAANWLSSLVCLPSYKWMFCTADLDRL